MVEEASGVPPERPQLGGHGQVHVLPALDTLAYRAAGVRGRCSFMVFVPP